MNEKEKLLPASIPNEYRHAYAIGFIKGCLNAINDITLDAHSKKSLAQAKQIISELENKDDNT